MTLSHDHPPHEPNSEPRYKRQRTALACHSCRRRKSKCNGSRPACDICISMGFACSYPKPARPSFPSNNDPEYVRRVEDRLGTLESQLETFVALVGGLQQQQSSVQQLEQIGNEGNVAPTGISNQLQDALESEACVGGAPEQSKNTDIADDTVDGMGTITFAEEIAAGHFGASSNSAFSNKIHHALRETLNMNRQVSGVPGDEGDVNNHISRPPSRPPSPYAMVSEKLTSPPSFERLNAFALPPVQVITQLVDSFFAETGMLFPYIHKKSIYQELEKLKQCRYSGIRRSWLCLLNTIMAFAIVLTPSQKQSDSRVSKADTFLQRALKLLPNVAFQPANVEILQALLLLTQYLQGTQRSTQTYNFQGLTVRIAFQIGLHCATGNTKDTILEREIKNRCWYMTYILDKTCSMTFGRPPCIRNDYLRCNPVVEVDFEDLELDINPLPGLAASDNTSTVSCFGQTIKLYRIVGEIIEKAYQNNIPSDTEFNYNTLIQHVTSLESNLETWKNGLPAPLHVMSCNETVLSSNDTSDFSNLSTVLTLRYLNARMLLHRAVLERFLDQDVQKRSSSEGNSSIFLRTFEQMSLDLSVSCAVETIGIHYETSKSRRRMLTTWWFSLYYVFSSSLVILAAIIVQHRRGILIDAIQNQDMMAVLKNALDALEYLGSESRMASRCRKYLSKLMNGLVGLGGPLSETSQQLNMIGDGTGFDNFTIPLSELSDISPIGLDMGPFMSGIEWDNFATPNQS